jgi:hypothetical protein
MVTGAKRNYSPGKLAKALNSAFIDAFKPMIRELNVQIQDTINTSTDIDGKPFKKLKKSTTSIRKKRGQPAQPPLKITGKMRGTKIKIATKTNLLFEIEMTGKSKKGVYYGSLHNKGFTSKGMISGKTVPARKWFGIPKNYKKGGARYEEARRAVRHNIKTSFDTVMRKII